MKIKNEQFFLTLKKFLQIYLVKNRSCSQNTIKSYTDSLNLYFTYLENEHNVPLYKMDWGCFTYDNVSNFLVWLGKERGNSKQTQIQRLTAIRAFVRYADILDATAVSVQAEIENIKLRKPPKELVPYLSKEQLSVFLKQPDVEKNTGLRNMVFLTVMYDTAARCQEMVDLKIGNLVLNTKSPCIYLVGKGDKTRVVPLMPKTVLHLKHYLEKISSCACTEKRRFFVFYDFSRRTSPYI